MLLNLVSNSLKFTNRKGLIKIKVILQGKDKKTLKLSVVDNGIGIKENDQNNLFKLFGAIVDQENRININGIGLGLVISKLIVENFDGNIGFKSKYNHGSTCFFTI